MIDVAKPATTGQLRTNVSEMKNGDFIIATFDFTTKMIGNIGKAIQDEISVLGNPWSSTSIGSFYFVKVDRGFLISDRVVANEVPWDTLNTNKLIQGLPYDSGNIVPVMTSNTGVASASSEYSNVYQAWRAFDGDNNTSWATNNTQTGWIYYKFSTPIKIGSYSIRNANSTQTSYYAGRSPKSWTFEGSNDGVGWTVLDTRSNEASWGSSEKRIYTFVNNQSFMYYRLNITANNGEAFIQIAEVEMADVGGSIRSLTGGVAYVDASGESLTTDKGLGAWPVNNEWDKYIVNFPLARIKAGNTVDDVFHVVPAATWCQDTPSITIPSAAASTRVVRGYQKATAFGYNVSSTTTSYLACFRPVFQYKE